MVQLSTTSKSITTSTTLLVFILLLFILCNNITRGDPRGPRSSHRGSPQSQHRKITNRRQEFEERQDRINQWIRTIREAPKGHSLSPSWTSKSRPQVIGVANLPLQNEAVQPNRQHSSNNQFHEKKHSVPNFNSISKHKFNAAPGGPLRQKRYPGKKNP